MWDIHLDEEDQVKYMHPFNCEARAYARLHEVGKEHLAVPCYGYLVLSKEHQAELRQKDLSHDWETDWGFYGDFTKRPLLALVKEFLDIPNVAYNDP